MELYDGEMLPDNLMGEAIARVILCWVILWKDSWCGHEATPKSNISQRKNFSGLPLVGLQKWWWGCWKLSTHSGIVVAIFYINRNNTASGLSIMSGLRDRFSFIWKISKK